MKLMEIAVLLQYSDPQELLKNIRQLESGSLSNETYTQSDVDIIERAFAEELIFLSYLNLNYDFYMPVLFPQNDYWLSANIPPSKAEAEQFWSRKYDTYSLAPQRDRLRPMSPRDRLKAILERNKQIKNEFSRWINDSINFYKQAEDRMTKIYENITGKKSS